MLKSHPFPSHLSLLPEKAIFLKEDRILVVADLHFGKVNHFRRAGLPVPPAANHRNAEALIDLINYHCPLRTIFLGDLFHSHYNEEWEVVGQIVKHFPSCKFELVRGNHDIMSAQQYHRKGIAVMEQARIGLFLLTHEPMVPADIPHPIVNLAGHIHPAAHLQGKGRQSITLPCFWFSKNQIILPAFGSFTGLAAVSPSESDRLFVILESKVMEVNKKPAKEKSKARS
jgi:DNA ligase-associated metallophosphoesterase